MANALVVAERRRILAADDVNRALRDIELLLANAIETDTSLVTVRQSSVMARAFNLSAYDASYLDLAKREGLPLATLDDPLRIAAKQARVAILS